MTRVFLDRTREFYPKLLKMTPRILAVYPKVLFFTCFIFQDLAQAQEAVSPPSADEKKSCCKIAPSSRAGFIAMAHAAEVSGPAGMIWVPGGEFTMGTDEEESYPAERPAHREKVGGFLIDQTEAMMATAVKIKTRNF